MPPRPDGERVPEGRVRGLAKLRAINARLETRRRRLPHRRFIKARRTEPSHRFAPAIQGMLCRVHPSSARRGTAGSAQSTPPAPPLQQRFFRHN